VKLCTLAARKARERHGPLITTVDLKNSFEEYSQGRLQDTINEFRSELPDIGRLLMGIKPNRRERTAKEGYRYKTDALLKKIRDIQGQGQFRFANGQIAGPSPDYSYNLRMPDEYWTLQFSGCPRVFCSEPANQLFY
jgi:hypothetical protein